MSFSYEYHQFLKFLYFEGYADSYEEAENLIEELTDEEFEELNEARRRTHLSHSFPLKPSELKLAAKIGAHGRREDPNEISATRSARESEPEEKKPRRTTKMSNVIVAQYLFGEGYADTLEGAEVIANNISGNWVNEILEKFDPKDYKEYHQKNHRTKDQSDEWDAQENDWQDSRGDIRDKHNMKRGVRKKKGV